MRPAGSPQIKVLKIGLGLGTITASDVRINCGPVCESSYTTRRIVTLTATPTPGTNSVFIGWSGDCSGLTCTELFLSPNAHTGLTSYASINSAIAVRMGQHRVTYQQNLSGKPDPLELRIDGKLTNMTGPEILLPEGGRIIRTPANGGIQIEGGGGTTVTITPGWLGHSRVWQLNVDISRARATKLAEDGKGGKTESATWRFTTE